MRAQTERPGIGWKLQILVFFAAATLVVLRRPDSVLNPQFFGEDSIWYPEAYTLGWFRAFFHPEGGYFEVIQRTAAALALLAPLRWAPLVMNAVGIICQVLPVNLVLSGRCRNWGSFGLRVVHAATYIALPNTSEVHVAVEEAQWHTALLATLVVLATVAPTRGWRIFDCAALVVGGLSGPFSIFLCPIALIIWWMRRERRHAIVATVVTACAAVQLSTILITASAERTNEAMGATAKLFLQIVAGRVYMAAVLGQHAFSPATQTGILLAFAVFGTAIVSYCLVKAAVEWKSFLSFCLLVWIASLKSPMVSWSVPQWQVLRNAPGIRYYFFPTLAFVWSLVWCLVSAPLMAVRLAACAGLAAMTIGIVKDWRYPNYTDHHFSQYAAQFESAHPGDSVTIPIFPDRWTMQLVKRENGCRSIPEGYIDEPAPDAQISVATTVSGWVRADEEIRSVRVYIDRKLAGTVIPDIPRPDVDRLYPRSPVKNKGWRTRLDLSNVQRGRHEIEVRAIESNGCDIDAAKVTVLMAR